MRLAGAEGIDKKDYKIKNPASKRSAIIAAKKISEKYKKMRKNKNVDLVGEIQDTRTNKNACIGAKKISQKYKKMRSKRPPLPFNFSQIVDADSVVYDNDTTLQDVASRKGAPIAAKKISQKY